MDNGELWNVKVIYSRSADRAEFRFLPPDGVPRAPMGMEFASVPLADEASQNAFLSRINAQRIQPITRDYLQLWQQQQHFMALGFYKGGQPVCETILTGTGANATLLMIYTRSDMRRQGMAKQLLGAASALLRERGFDQPELYPVCAQAARLFRLPTQGRELTEAEQTALTDAFYRYAPGDNSLSALAVTGALLAAGAVSTGKIEDRAVTAAKLAEQAVTASALAAPPWQ